MVSSRSNEVSNFQGKADRVDLGYAFDTSLQGPPDYLRDVLGMPMDITVPEGYPTCNSIEFGLCPSREGMYCHSGNQSDS
jgi:hypothetical protein